MATQSIVFVTISCKNCGKDFSFRPWAGQRRLHCSKECRVKYQVSQRANLPTCSVEGCASRVRSSGTPLCEKHYGRKRRGVPVALPRNIKGRYVTAAGYIKLLVPGHPMADSNNHAFEHRVVSYDRAKGNQPQCHWCGKALVWASTVVDHLNEIKSDNRPSNLVNSCNDCNRARGAIVPFIRRMRPEAVQGFMDTVILMRQ